MLKAVDFKSDNSRSSFDKKIDGDMAVTVEEDGFALKNCDVAFSKKFCKSPLGACRLREPFPAPFLGEGRDLRVGVAPFVDLERI